MIFTPDNIERILRGDKTMTRRVVKPGDHFEMVTWTMMTGGFAGSRSDGTGVIRDGDERKRWCIGQDYAICPGRGKKAVGRIRITDIRRERLQDISTEDCVREGAAAISFQSASARFMAIWDGLYGNDPVKGWEANPDVWVISFTLVPEAEVVS